ncbi:MAG: polysaccharide deacetylase family protein [Ruminococcus sp.]|nr:polysaccharide deacetylase family protein [Ruminococcus sp.]MCM1381092.1 polysaccharide deacetylase family protein [Muribaculaceae bacterium]MCM1478684.1 polysaccharide deacetylase family protein [Muribaculaceae bacterium]
MYFCFRFKKFVLLLLTAAVLAGCAVKFTADGLRYEPAAAVEEEIFVPIIMYHSLLKDPVRAGEYVVSPEIFEADMKYLLDNGYTTVFVSELADYVENGADLPEKPVAVTFDDGYCNVMEYACPFMLENNVKATVNVVGAYTEQSTAEDDHNPAYSYLTWEEISALAQSGVFEIGSHTYDMHGTGARNGCKKKYGENVSAYRAALTEDIGGLQEMLTEKSGVTPVTFAYPYGFISEESVPVLKEMGFRALLTCYEKPNYISRDNPECLFQLNRYNRPSGISTEEFMEKILNQK